LFRLQTFTLAEDVPTKMGSCSDEDFDFSDEDTETKASTEEFAIKRPGKKVFGQKHLLELKKTLELDSFKEKKNTRKERKRRQKERKRLQKKQLAGSLLKLINN
jgi:hypothetical protein